MELRQVKVSQACLKSDFVPYSSYFCGCGGWVFNTKDFTDRSTLTNKINLNVKNMFKTFWLGDIVKMMKGTKNGYKCLINFSKTITLLKEGQLVVKVEVMF